MRPLVVATVLAASLGALVGCAPASPALPDGVEVSVFQNRSDYASRTLVIGVINGTDAPLTLSRAEFTSPRFESAALWERGTELRPGAQVDLRVPLPVSVCGVEGEPTVTLAFETPAGAGTATVTPTDERGRLDEINRDECLGESVAEIAALGLADLDWTPGAHEPATIALTATPAQGTGSLEIVSVAQTVLLALVDDRREPVEAVPVEAVPVGVEVAAGGGGVASVPLAFVPSRCDPHAVAEDKRGTFFPVEIAIDGGATGIVYVAATDEQRVAIYDYIGDYCGY